MEGEEQSQINSSSAPNERSQSQRSKSTVSRATQPQRSGGAGDRSSTQSVGRQAVNLGSPGSSGSGGLDSKKNLANRRVKWYVKCSANMVENRFTVAFTTALTIYALTGDDIRLITTNKPADMTFNVIVILCIIVFTLECVLSCIGKEDYWGGFFFSLDVVSTATLVLDLSWIADELAGGDSEGDSASAMRGGRTARVGAKAGRVVRVIRLVRILKLYKAYYDSKQAKKKREDQLMNDEDDWDDVDVENKEEPSAHRESRVGKKLSEMTIRRVIILVLTMLLVFPFLAPEAAKQNAESAYYAADDVLRKFTAKFTAVQETFKLIDDDQNGRLTKSEIREAARIRGDQISDSLARQMIKDVDSDEDGALDLTEFLSHLQERAARCPGPSCQQYHKAKIFPDRLAWRTEDYERSLLKFIYFHNWFPRRDMNEFCPEKGCSDMYFSQVFWVGIQGLNEGPVSLRALAAPLDLDFVQKWENMYKGKDNIYNYGQMPEEAKGVISKPWVNKCRSKGKNPMHRYGFSLLWPYTIDGVFSHQVKCPEDLRPVERRKFYARVVTEDEWEQYHLSFYFDLRPFSRADAAFNLSITGFICLVLCVAAMSFSNDANNLVLTPVENMIKRVEAIRDNPLIAMRMADEEFKAEEVAKAKIRKKNKEAAKAYIQDFIQMKRCRRTVNEPMETVILEKTIIKLGSLLALGFGEAGANIIGANMRGSDTAGVNAMIPGVRVECIIGVVRIRDFSVATEVLHTKIMNFVNQIAEIVHGCVDEFHGAANKNNGDTFLIIWRLQEFYTEDWTTRVAEMSVVAFSKVLGSLHRSPLLAGYRGHPGLQQRLGTGCRVNLSFALHCGWAIEGAVGSEFKIDASYLSPNVSIVTTIEKATQTYGVPILLASSVFELLGERMAEKCRLIDNVVITGSPRPMNLFSVDCDYMSIKVDKSEPLQITWNSRQRFRARQFNESVKTGLKKEDTSIVEIFDKDGNIKVMRRRFTQEFFQNFNMGYQNYAEGEWAVARRMLVSTQTLLGVEDGPSSALLRFMKEYQFERPKDWPGYRLLALRASSPLTSGSSI